MSHDIDPSDGSQLDSPNDEPLKEENMRPETRETAVPSSGRMAWILMSKRDPPRLPSNKWEVL